MYLRRIDWAESLYEAIGFNKSIQFNSITSVNDALNCTWSKSYDVISPYDPHAGANAFIHSIGGRHKGNACLPVKVVQLVLQVLQGGLTFTGNNTM